MYKRYNFQCPYCGGHQLDRRIKTEGLERDVKPAIYVREMDNDTSDAQLDIDDDATETLYYVCSDCDHEWDDMEDLIGDNTVLDDDDNPVDALGNVKQS